MNQLPLLLEGLEKEFSCVKVSKRKDTFNISSNLDKAMAMSKRFIMFNIKTGEVVELYPGQCRSFFIELDLNFNTVMNRRSVYPNKDIPCYAIGVNGQHNNRGCAGGRGSAVDFDWVMLAKNKTNSCF